MAQWNPVTPDFRSSNQSHAIANDTAQKAGESFSKVGDSLSRIGSMVENNNQKKIAQRNEQLLLAATEINDQAAINSIIKNKNKTTGEDINTFDIPTYQQTVSESMALYAQQNDLTPLEIQRMATLIDGNKTIEQGTKTADSLNKPIIEYADLANKQKQTSINEGNLNQTILDENEKNRIAILKLNQDKINISISDKEKLEKKVLEDKQKAFNKAATNTIFGTQEEFRNDYQKFQELYQQAPKGSEDSTYYKNILDVMTLRQEFINNDGSVVNANDFNTKYETAYQKAFGTKVPDTYKLPLNEAVKNEQTLKDEAKKIQQNRETTVIEFPNELLKKGQIATGEKKGYLNPNDIKIMNSVLTGLTNHENFKNLDPKLITSAISSLLEFNKTFISDKINIDSGRLSIFKEALANPDDLNNPLINILSIGDEEQVRKVINKIEKTKQKTNTNNSSSYYENALKAFTKSEAPITYTGGD